MDTSGVDLYYFSASPPCRSVLLLIKALGLMVNLKPLNILKGEQMNPEFVKLNPQHVIPTLVDHDFVLWESRAILKYLENQYDKDHKYLPTDPKMAAKVDQLLYFDATTLFQYLHDYFVPILLHGEKPDTQKAEKVKNALKLLDTLLENNEWAAGPQITIADFALVASVSTAEAVEFDITEYPHVNEWYQKIKKSLEPYGYKEFNQEGTDMFKEIFNSKLKAK